VAAPGLNGCGFSTPWGIPTIACVGAPQIGNPSFAVTANVPCAAGAPTAALLLVGICRSPSLLIRGPFGAGGFCGPTEAVCALFVEPVLFTLPGSPRAGGFDFAMPLPNDPGLRGLTACVQEANLCPVQGGACVAASQGIAITLF
jgi:hypothetical protein